MLIALSQPCIANHFNNKNNNVDICRLKVSDGDTDYYYVEIGRLKVSDGDTDYYYVEIGRFNVINNIIEL